MERAVRDSETIQRDPANAHGSAPGVQVMGAFLSAPGLGRTHAWGLQDLLVLRVTGGWGVPLGDLGLELGAW